MKFEGAIFDMDGLLFDTERVYQDTWKELAAERDIRLAYEFPKAISGTNGAYMMRVIEKYYNVSDGSEIMNACMERIQQKLTIEVPVKKGVQEILQFFRSEGSRIAVASSSSKEQIQANLCKAGIESYFDTIVSGKDVANGKPAPDIFLYAAEQIGCSPDRCCVFEDSENGVRAGHAAGCTTYMIPDLFEPSAAIRPYADRIYPDLLAAMEGIRSI